MRLTLIPFLVVLHAGCSSSSSETTTPTTATQMVGPEGATIEVDGAKVTFPRGALAEAKAITISSTTSVPDGFVALSKVFRCEPSGTAFAQPVVMTMPFVDDGKGPFTMFWSTGEDPTFKDIGGTAEGRVMTATVMHFSSGFLGRKK